MGRRLQTTSHLARGLESGAVFCPSADTNRPKMVVVILMGVCGCGKTTVGEALAEKLQWPFRDADEFHSEANKQKMSSGVPLTDEDRLPWLLAIYDYLNSLQEGKQSAVLTCSALKRRYRDVLRTGCTTTSPCQEHTVSASRSPQLLSSSLPSSSSSSSSFSSSSTVFVYLKGSRKVLEARLGARRGHFMPSDLLASQLDTLEEPGADEEGCLTVEVDAAGVAAIVDAIARGLESGV